MKNFIKNLIAARWKLIVSFAILILYAITLVILLPTAALVAGGVVFVFYYSVWNVLEWLEKL